MKTNIMLLWLLMLLSFSAHAAPPAVSYQGYLTDPSGSPINGTIDITFTLYDTLAAGSSQWTETQSVTLSQGLFQVQLGDNILNPFAANLFDIPLWLGMAVDVDPEMSPRTSLSSVGYALKAEDADTLGGLGPVDLDQSAHLGDTANPHSVTAAQTGAASLASLSAHTADSANPHNVTAKQAGAASIVDLTTHSRSPSAHHSRYINKEAIVAMGSKADDNALNHDQYTDSQAIAAIKADAGTGLNADTVDNLHANEIIDAASDEVRTPISSLPFSINTSGSYYVTQSLDGSSGGIDVNVDDVTIDLMGFTLNGNGVDDFGIYWRSRSAIVIKNGTIRGFGLAGIFNGDSSSTVNVVSELQVIANGSLGTTHVHSGIFLGGSSNRVERCIAKDNGSYGIYVGTNSIVKDSSAENSGGTSGIYGGSGSTLNNNTASNNQGISGIFGNGSTLSNNTAYYNQGWGIYTIRRSTVMGNTIFLNNQSQKANQGGLHIGYDTQAENNTATNNFETGIYVYGSNNILRNNHATNSFEVDSVKRCIHFVSGDNAAIGNTATECDIQFSGSLPPIERFIGNIGW